MQQPGVHCERPCMQTKPVDLYLYEPIERNMEEDFQVRIQMPGSAPVQVSARAWLELRSRAQGFPTPVRLHWCGRHSRCFAVWCKCRDSSKSSPTPGSQKPTVHRSWKLDCCRGDSVGRSFSGIFCPLSSHGVRGAIHEADRWEVVQPQKLNDYDKRPGGAGDGQWKVGRKGGSETRCQDEGQRGRERQRQGRRQWKCRGCSRAAFSSPSVFDRAVDVAETTLISPPCRSLLHLRGPLRVLRPMVGRE